MKKFNWEEFKDVNNRIAVHCKTEDEAKDFCKKMHEHGLRWCHTDSYIERTNWHIYKEKTCYSNSGRYCNKDYYIENDFKILEWSDYMKVGNKEFTKADLKDGMVVEYRDGDRLLVFGHKLLDDNNFDFINDIADDLTDKKYKDKDFDIMKVYKVNIENVKKLSDILKHENLELIWERSEPKKMTTEEMRQKLKELTGEKIEFEPSVEEMIGVICKYCRKAKCNTCVIPSGMSCNFANYSKDEVKKVYEKVMEDGRKES